MAFVSSLTPLSCSSFCAPAATPSAFAPTSTTPRAPKWAPATRHTALNRSRSRLAAAVPQMTSAGEEEETVSLQDLQRRLGEKERPGEPQKEEAPGAEGAPGEDKRTEKEKEIDRLRAAEKFIQVDEGKFECMGCGYLYDPTKGDSRNDIPANTPFEDLPGSYTCGQCRTPKRRFVSRKKVIAGFADNQKYGFGSNQMTGGEKSLLIFGALAFCFLLLLSGYAMN